MPLPFYPRGMGPDIHWIGRWMGHRGAWRLWRREKSYTVLNRTRAVQSVARHDNDLAILTPPIPFHATDEICRLETGLCDSGYL
jgi:hypothetical protein